VKGCPPITLARIHVDPLLEQSPHGLPVLILGRIHQAEIAIGGG
jgi:hypothetical protein